jgi:hypothetical protein
MCSLDAVSVKRLRTACGHRCGWITGGYDPTSIPVTTPPPRGWRCDRGRCGARQLTTRCRSARYDACVATRAGSNRSRQVMRSETAVQLSERTPRPPATSVPRWSRVLRWACRDVTLRPHPIRDASRQAAPRTPSDHRSRWSEAVLWACQDVTLGPHPSQSFQGNSISCRNTVSCRLTSRSCNPLLSLEYPYCPLTRGSNAGQTDAI